ncbi:3-hydroxybutyryl-CoA dehydrogenase [Syntrophomonas wolfei]|mgnify:FL=1|jgi:3-hydroxybutyryl-CoA dehydrogenase|uniref:3-hydroxybutyryl-CoA dehydrogenase n=1 Tax=Syntrophomonas wolfei subsp. wolfei (strain DSM 2245B / Goettingen) TaxID=335541 RepID=Q0AWW5_SYNWW|nr:3-hydroxybutyryl-CoA dehydrogenase [Syntrophomonas wolfei]ABI68789.1 3-hydroxyacyl-CoA dehydrogenase [Syntrophomonas wolfei subsp. wolfei str. Goettingen G311]
MTIKKIMVIGAGQMGGGIAQVSAQAGYDTVQYDINMDLVNKGLAVIEKNLSRDVSKGKKSKEDKAAILGRIKPSVKLEDAADCDLVVEAIVENFDIKKQVFSQLDQIAPAHAILASNTSSLPITQIAATTKRPEKVIGMHFMNPVPVMKLVEIIRGLATTDEVYKIIEEASIKMGKTPVWCKDVPGFISNRVLQVMINEALWELYEGVAPAENIDNIMKLGMNHPMGPCELADLIGLDTILSILNVMYDGYGDPKYRPSPLLKQYVQAGWLGRKTGKGIYDYRK